MAWKYRSLFCFTLAHFLVDFTCAYLVFSQTAGSSFFYTGLFLYNFCAFALQMPLGVLADRFRRGGRISALGCIFLAFPLFLLLPAPAMILLAGTGNALFHLGGGISVLQQNPGRCTEPGIFVSSGALGIYLGTLAGNAKGIPGWPQAAGLICFAAIFLLLPEHRTAFHRQLPAQPPKPAPLVLPFLFLTLVVCIRSFLGLIQIFEWKTESSLALAAVLATVGGKALGGIFSDRFGSLRTVIGSLAAASVLFLLSSAPLPGLLAVLLFNMTMPITLTALVRLFPGHPGFCFGVLTFALFLGFLPPYLGLRFAETLPLLYAALSLVSLLFMAAAWKLRRWRR